MHDSWWVVIVFHPSCDTTDLFFQDLVELAILLRNISCSALATGLIFRVKFALIDAKLVQRDSSGSILLTHGQSLDQFVAILWLVATLVAAVIKCFLCNQRIRLDDSSLALDFEHLVDRNMRLVHPIHEMNHLNRDLSFAQLLVDGLFWLLNLFNFVLFERGVSVSKIESAVQFLERNHAKFLLHQVVDKQT